MCRAPVAHLQLPRRHLPVRVELDAVGRVQIDHLHLAAQGLLLGKARHHGETVAEDQAVRPLQADAVVLVVAELVLDVGDAVEVGEQVGRVGVVLQSFAPSCRRRMSAMIALGCTFSWM